METQEQTFINGKIHTMATPGMVEALRIRNGRIIAMGSTADIWTRGQKDVEVIDLAGATVLPGFIETHMHPLFWGVQAQQLRLSPECRSIDSVVAEIRAEASKHPSGSLLKVWRFDHTRMRDGRHLTAADLDQASEEHEILVRNVCGHICYANTRRIEACALTVNDFERHGPDIVTDENGNVVGQFNELSAMELVDTLLPIVDRAGNLDAITKAAEMLASRGVTTVHDMGVFGMPFVQAYWDAYTSNQLTFRVRMYLWRELLDNALVPEGFGNDFLEMGGYKFAIDGAIIGATACMSVPYGNHGRGIMNEDYETFASAVAHAHDLGFQVAIHAEGDAGIEWALDAIEAALMASPRANHRHRLEHAIVVRADQVARAARLGVAVSAYINVVADWGDYLADDLLPAELATRLLPLAEFETAGLDYALHSDCPITDVNPLASIVTAITRAGQSGRPIAPEQGISFHDAVRRYTVAAARLGFNEGDRGSLGPGMLGDLVVLSEDPFNCQPGDLGHVEVSRTVVGGRTIWTTE